MRKLRADIVAGYLDQNDFLTARFEIPSILITSQIHQGEQEVDLYAEKLNLNQQPLEFKKSGKTIHKLRLVETCVLDDQGDPLSLDSLILSEQTWYLKEGQSGIAEMSAQLSSLAEAPDGDVVIDPSLLFGSFNVATMDSYLLGNSYAKFGGSSNIYFYSGQPYRAVFTCDVSSLGASREIISAKLNIYSATNTTTSSAQFRVCNITSTWWEACVNWFERDCGISWNTAGGDYTTANSALTTIPAGLTGTHEIDLTAPFKARYPSGLSDITGKGFLILLENTPGGYINYYSKEYSNTALRWKMEITYAVVQNVTINPSDGKLYAPRQRTVTATINPPVAGVTVNFRVIDVDDPANYLTIDPNGSLGGDNYNDSYSLSVASAQTNASGQAQTVFTANNKYGGNNYVVEASVSGSAMNSPTMEVWRKLKIEYFAMANTPYITPVTNCLNPPEPYDFDGNPSHKIPYQYLSGSSNDLNSIFGAINDGSKQSNRNTYISTDFKTSVTNPPIVSFTEINPNQPNTTFTDSIIILSAHWGDGTAVNYRLTCHGCYSFDGIEDPERSAAGSVPSIGSRWVRIWWDSIQWKDKYARPNVNDVPCICTQIDGNDNPIGIPFDETWSNYYKPDDPSIDTGNANYVAIIAHEIGHSLGEYHSVNDYVADTNLLRSLMQYGTREENELKRFGVSAVSRIRKYTQYLD